MGTSDTAYVLSTHWAYWGNKYTQLLSLDIKHTPTPPHSVSMANSSVDLSISDKEELQ